MDEAEDELTVMAEVSRALAKLDDVAALRVINWISARRGVAASKPAQAGSSAAELDQPEDLAALFEVAAPATQDEKALVGAYWLQVVQQRGDLDAQSLNNELKNLGHGVPNITSALDQLIRQRPQLVLQVRKSGTTKQARKKYRVTNEGIKRVKGMLTKETQSAEQ